MVLSRARTIIWMCGHSSASSSGLLTELELMSSTCSSKGLFTQEAHFINYPSFCETQKKPQELHQELIQLPQRSALKAFGLYELSFFDQMRRFRAKSPFYVFLLMLVLSGTPAQHELHRLLFRTHLTGQFNCSLSAFELCSGKNPPHLHQHT